MDILGFGFLADENDFFAGSAQHFRLVSIKYTATTRSARGGGQTLCQGYLVVVRIQSRMQQLFQ